jgi:hypothetical protein
MSTFRAYLVTPAIGPRQWLTVRGEAVKAATGGGDWDEVEVPATKVGLIPFLNALEALFAAAEPPEAPEAPEPPPVAPAALVGATPAFTADAIVGFILDRASVREVERIYEAIGTRVAERLSEHRRAA